MAAKEQSIRDKNAGQSRCGQSSTVAPSPDSHSAFQDGLSFFPLDSNENREIQPFPRSPKLLRKLNRVETPSQEQLSRRLEELQAEKLKTEAHILSLKKRRADLLRSTEVMKQQVRERFDAMRAALRRDEQEVLNSLDQDQRRTTAELDQVLKTWDQHLDLVRKTASNTEKKLSNSENREVQSENVSFKKPDASENQIGLNKERFERLQHTLVSLTKLLKVQLQRKTLLLDSSPMVMDRQTCHGQIAVTSDGCGLTFSSVVPPTSEHPLKFDKVCCALASSPVAAGQSYWEVDVRCCSNWAVGAAYGCLERKGNDKGAKLGRNRNSWCVELRNGQLSAWHNDHHIPCQGVGQTLIQKVGVRVNYEKGQLMFYDAESQCVLQKFSAAVTPVFDRAHHHFTEPLYAAIRFLRPHDAQAWPNHLRLCHLDPLY
ncbi:E3 ubiquitin-protein ligase TRIM62 [Neosynchiropus ocellatus]